MNKVDRIVNWSRIIMGIACMIPALIWIYKVALSNELAAAILCIVAFWLGWDGLKRGLSEFNKDTNNKETK